MSGSTVDEPSLRVEYPVCVRSLLRSRTRISRLIPTGLQEDIEFFLSAKCWPDGAGLPIGLCSDLNWPRRRKMVKNRTPMAAAQLSV